MYLQVCCLFVVKYKVLFKSWPISGRYKCKSDAAEGWYQGLTVEIAPLYVGQLRVLTLVCLVYWTCMCMLVKSGWAPPTGGHSKLIENMNFKLMGSFFTLSAEFLHIAFPCTLIKSKIEWVCKTIKLVLDLKLLHCSAVNSCF